MASNSEIQIIVQAATEIQQKGLIYEIDGLDLQLENMTRVLEQSRYLSDLNDEVLYYAYSQALLSDNVTSFVDFELTHRDAYLRMKFRALKS